MRVWLMVFMFAAAGVSICHAEATTDKYHLSMSEKAACTPDAVRLCSMAYPDEDLLLACMKQNRASLSQICRVAFDAGIKRRHL